MMDVWMDELMDHKLFIYYFGDIVDVAMPHYLSFSQLDREHAIYLSDAYEKTFNYINHPSVQAIPAEVLNAVTVVDFQRFDTMIDTDGQVFDWSMKWKYPDAGMFTPNDEDAFDAEKRLSAVNNYRLDDRIDLEKTILYNLIEIRPKYPELSADYQTAP